jgi:hypothetical protein
MGQGPFKMAGGMQGEAPWIFRHGRAVQVDPIKPTLKAPGTKRLKLNFDTLISNVLFKFYLRCYNTEEGAAVAHDNYLNGGVDPVNRREGTSSEFKAGAYTRQLFGST